jgi:solute carrier family 12 sodium/potassium/chloride transporter 2
MKDAMFIVMLISLSNFIVGSIMGPTSESEEARGFIGYSSKSINVQIHSLLYLILKKSNFIFTVDLLNENWGPSYTITGGQMQNFISVFSVYFPASIGILAGANVSGDLKVYLNYFIL